MRSYGRPNRKCASITSSPLFASVAESTVIFGPMRQVGCASACSGVTSSSSTAGAAAERAAGSREHERVDLLRLASFEALEERRVLAVDGQDPAAAALARSESELPGGDEALLVREREVDAVLERPQRRVDSREADDGVEDDVGLRRARGARSGRPRPPSAARGRRRAASSRRPRRRARAPDAPRRSRSPGDRSIPWPRAALRASPAQCRESASENRTRPRGSTPRARRRAGRRSGRACRRARREAFRCP